MTRDRILEIAREVYGLQTTWHGTTLLRLELLANKLMAAERDAIVALLPEHCGQDAERITQAIRARNKEDA